MRSFHPWTNYNAVFNFLSTTTRKAGFLVQWHKEFAQNVQLNSHKTNDPNEQTICLIQTTKPWATLKSIADITTGRY